MATKEELESEIEALKQRIAELQNERVQSGEALRSMTVSGIAVAEIEYNISEEIFPDYDGGTYSVERLEITKVIINGEDITTSEDRSGTYSPNPRAVADSKFWQIMAHGPWVLTVDLTYIEE